MRKIIDFFKNSRFHYFLAYVLEKMEMGGLTVSYSLGGEDLIIKKLLPKGKKVFYVDVGCNNPIQGNNTFKLYLKGSSGICIDGNKSIINRFKQIRTRDICLNELVSDKKEKITFYQTDIHEYSTIDASIGQHLIDNNLKIQKIEAISITLEEILDQYANNRHIDLLCIDVEGHDLNVLKGNNFSKYRPSIICIENHGDITTAMNGNIHAFLKSSNYGIKAFCGENIYFKDQRHT